MTHQDFQEIGRAVYAAPAITTSRFIRDFDTAKAKLKELPVEHCVITKYGKAEIDFWIGGIR